MANSMMDFMNAQGLERIAHMIQNDFEKTSGHKLTDDEIKYLETITPAIFYEYTSVRDDEEIQVVNGDEKDKLESLLDDMVQKLSKLIVIHIKSRLEAYVLYKRIKMLEGIIKDDDSGD
jgi:hypothetical protein